MDANILNIIKIDQFYQYKSKTPGTLKDILNTLSGVNDGFGIKKTIAADTGISSDEHIEIIKYLIYLTAFWLYD
ncbi:MAG: hypothetical protein J7K96_10135 [Desulfobacteraceae bacterium]|nr:hypothetical protein [Desulfobacteraceae bacterium]